MLRSKLEVMVSKGSNSDTEQTARLMLEGCQHTALGTTGLGGAESFLAECGRLVGVEGLAKHDVPVVADNSGVPLLPIEVQRRA